MYSNTPPRAAKPATPPAYVSIPLWAASTSEVISAISAASDTVVSPAGTLNNWLNRHAEVLTNPSELFWGAALLFDEQGGAGWAGWVPYWERPGFFQSTTYLAPRLRGTGLIPRLRCEQVHRAQSLTRRWGLSGAEFVSSISAKNDRSLAASRRYAESAGWTDWYATFEKSTSREAWVLRWPEGMDHSCFLPGAARPPLKHSPGTPGGILPLASIRDTLPEQNESERGWE